LPNEAEYRSWRKTLRVATNAAGEIDSLIRRPLPVLLVFYQYLNSWWSDPLTDATVQLRYCTHHLNPEEGDEGGEGQEDDERVELDRRFSEYD